MHKSAKGLIKELNKFKNPQKAKILQGFFKTGPGEYGEGDIFLGITAPIQRNIAKKYIALDLKEIQKLLNSKIHEHRSSALVLLVSKYQQGNEKIKKQIFGFYLKNSTRINNWDLVDTSAPQIVGNYLLNHSKKILYRLVESKNLWQRRIAILATFTFIRKNDFTDTLKISKILLKDKHDLIHKAVGWMLREIGKRNKKILLGFLKKYSAKMPRVMLRYSIEKLTQKEKRQFLKK